MQWYRESNKFKKTNNLLISGSEIEQHPEYRTHQNIYHIQVIEHKLNGVRPHLQYARGIWKRSCVIRLSLPSTLIRRENGSLRKQSSNQKKLRLNTAQVCILVRLEAILKAKPFWKTTRLQWSWYLPWRVFLRHKSRWLSVEFSTFCDPALCFGGLHRPHQRGRVEREPMLLLFIYNFPW